MKKIIFLVSLLTSLNVFSATFDLNAIYTEGTGYYAGQDGVPIVCNLGVLPDCAAGDTFTISVNINDSYVSSGVSGSISTAEAIASGATFDYIHKGSLWATASHASSPFEIFNISWDVNGDLTSLDIWWTGAISPHYIWNTGVAGVGTGIIVHEQGCDSLNDGGAGCQAMTDYTYGMSVVPVPAAAWMFGSALLGLAGLKRKRD
jgi:hypothetical protein